MGGSASRCPAWIAGTEGVQSSLPRDKSRGGGLKGRFRLDIWEIVFMGREVRYWNREIDGGITLGVFKNKWMWYLRSWVSTGLGSAVGELMINDLRFLQPL